MDIRFLDIAQRELDEAVEYYHAESPGLGEQLLLEVLSTLDRIRQYPESWPQFTQNTRRCQTRRFPCQRLSPEGDSLSLTFGEAC